MKLKCRSCGEVFDRDNAAIEIETHGFEGGPYEKFAYCPICHGESGEVEECADCGEAFPSGDLFHGLCKDCIKKSITFDGFERYANSKYASLNSYGEKVTLADFMFIEVWHQSQMPKNLSSDFLYHIETEYKRLAAQAKLFESNGMTADLRGQIEDYLFCGDDDEARAYAEWLMEEERK